MKRIAIITTHPIQYNAPVFKLLSLNPELKIKVFYTLGKTSSEIVDRGFGRLITWDIPLLDGYDYVFVPNTSKNPSTSYFDGIINPDIINQIEYFDPTDILVFGWSFNSHLKILRHFKGKAIIHFRGDSTLLDEKSSLRVLIRRILLKWVYKYIDKAFYVGTNNRNYFKKHGVPESKLEFVPHAIDNERFGYNVEYSNESKEIRKELGIPEGNLVFLFIGKFTSKKNPNLLLEAFKQVNNSRTSLLFVGNGVLEDILKKDSLGYNNVHFLPFQNQKRMPAVYRAGNVLVLPSRGPGETWGLCINEAMVCGLPIIASDKVGCAIDLVKEEQNGNAFKSENLESLVTLLNKYSNLPEHELNRLGQNSNSIIAEWNYSNLVKAMERAFLQNQSISK